jgi:hypothetical protein
MNEEERAERFARDLDQFLFGNKESHAELDDDDFTSLLDVASRRLDRSNATRQRAEQYEADVWERLLERLNGDAEDAGTTGDSIDAHGMTDVISTRRRFAEEAQTLAECHREDVWIRIQSRLSEDGSARPHPAGAGASPSTAADYTSDDPEFDSLVRIALSNTHAPPRDPEMTQRLWARVGGFPDPREMGRSLDRRWETTSIPASLAVKALGFAAAAAILLVAIGPLPTTGFADHPFIEAVGHLAGETGVVESSDPPPAPSSGVVPVNGSIATVEEARSFLDLPIGKPSYLPAGMVLVSSNYYETGITSPDGGVYSLAYATPDESASLVIYQESGDGPNLAARTGNTTDTVVDGFPASYFQGGWRSEDGALTWIDVSSQSLVFEPNGLRVIIHYSGPPIDPLELLSVADSMNFG